MNVLINNSVSIVIPIHNQGIYLERALASILWQLSPFDECILVDDGSTDHPEKFLSDDAKRRVLILQEASARGVSAARNRGIRRASCHWIKFLDADDLLAPFALDAFRAAAAQMPDTVQVFTGGVTRVIDGFVADSVGCTIESLRRILLENPMLPSATFVRRNALLEVGLFDERIDFEEDWDLWLRLYERYTLDGFGVSQSPICYYWIDNSEKTFKARRYTVDGVSVREYFSKTYGCRPDDWE